MSRGGPRGQVLSADPASLRPSKFNLGSSQLALGAYYRRLSPRTDKSKAITAAADKLARLIYAMLTKGEEYTDAGQD